MNNYVFPVSLGDALAAVSLVLFIIANRYNIFHHKKTRPHNREIITPSPGDPIFSQNFRLSIYSRIFLGIIVGITLDRIICFIFDQYIHGYRLNILSFQLNQGATRFFLIIIFPIIFATFFEFVFIKYSPSLKLFTIHWLERLFFAFLIFSILVQLVSIGESYNGLNVYHSALLSIALGVLLIVFISFPSTPVSMILRLLRTKITVNIHTQQLN